MKTVKVKLAVPKAVAEGDLGQAGLPVRCYVLENGQRVLSGRQAVAALTLGPQTGDTSSGPKNGHAERFLGRTLEKSGGAKAGPRLIEFWTRKGLARGIEADDFVQILKGFSERFVAGTLHPKQLHIGRHATMYLGALASTGLVALIDEVTGQQDVRCSRALTRHLQSILRAEAGTWECTFPRSLAVALAKLHRDPWHGVGSYPRSLAEDFGFIYQLAVGPEVIGELRRRNPEPRFGRNHHQFLRERSRRDLQSDLRVAEALAHQCATPTEWRHRMRAHFEGEALQLSLDGHVRSARPSRTNTLTELAS